MRVLSEEPIAGMNRVNIADLGALMIRSIFK
jgi:hypothetical protein